jgi:chromosome segregation ATPase
MPTATQPAAVVSELKASGDATRRQIDEMQRQVSELEQQAAHRLKELDQHAGKTERSSPDLDTARAQTDERRQAIDNLGPQIADLKQLLAQRWQDLAGPDAEAVKPRHDMNALDTLAQEQAYAAARGAYAAVVAEQNAVQEALRRQVADLRQQGAQNSQVIDAAHDEVAKLRQDIDALDLPAREQQADALASGPSGAVVAEQRAAQDALRRQVAELQQQVAQRSRDLDAARAEAASLRQDIDALDLLPREQQPEQAASGSSAAILAEQRAGQDALQRQVTELQQQGAQRSQDLDTARAEAARLRQDIAALESSRKTQEQQAAAAAAGMPMAHSAAVRPPRNNAEVVAVMSPPRIPTTTGEPPVQSDHARAGAQAGAPQPTAEARVEASVVPERLGKARFSPDPARKQAAKPVVSSAIGLETRAAPARPQAAERPMRIEINAMRAAPSRCVSILKRVQLGEALTDDDRTVLRTNCGPG